MAIITAVICVSGVYFFVVFFLSRFLVPFMGFGQYQPPREIPREMKDAIAELEAKSSDPRSFLENAYALVRSRWQATRLGTVRNLPLAFRTDLEELWSSPGYAHCHTINYLLRTILVRSKFFREGEVRTRHGFMNFFIHQYLQVRIRGRWTDADPSLAHLRLPIGRHASWFG